MIHLDHRDARPIYEQIIAAFIQQISSGILRPGDRMPSVRELSGQLSINPNTIQRGYRELERQGWIVSIPGKGSYVCDKPSAGEHERRELLKTFDETARTLIAQGVSPVELIARLTQLTGGGTNA